MLKPNAKRSIEDIFETTIQSTYKIWTQISNNKFDFVGGPAFRWPFRIFAKT